MNNEIKELLQNENVIYFISDLINEKNDYKLRIEKAVEYIMSELVDEWSIKNDGCVDGSDLPVNAITPILDILNGKE